MDFSENFEVISLIEIYLMIFIVFLIFFLEINLLKPINLIKKIKSLNLCINYVKHLIETFFYFFLHVSGLKLGSV